MRKWLYITTSRLHYKQAAHCTVRLIQELSQFTCIITKVYNLLCFFFCFFFIFNLFSTCALSSVHCQQLRHCKNKNTQHDQTFNYIFLGGKKSKYSTLHHSNKKRNPPSHKSHLRGEFTPFSKMKLRTWMIICKNPYWRITINKSTC